MLISEITQHEYIQQTLKQYFLKYGPEEIINDIVNVDGSLKLLQKCHKLPIKFGKINGNVDFRSMALKTLEGCPEEVVGTFYIGGNPLHSLEGGPRIVSDYYACNSCYLTSLNGSPKITAEFDCKMNRLESFEGGPEIVRGPFMAADNPLTSLKGLPKEITEDISITINETLPLLRLLFVKNLKRIRFNSDPALMAGEDSLNVESIINKYIRQGKGGALACAAELTKAGYKGNARL